MTLPNATATRKMRIAGDPCDLVKVRDQVREFSRQIGFGDSESVHIALATDEALANVIKHGYGGACGEPIDIELVDTGKSGKVGIKIAIRDYGRKVDPSAIRGRALEDVRPGGLGVHIIKSVMDSVDYRPADGAGMVLVMNKQQKA